MNKFERNFETGIHAFLCIFMILVPLALILGFLYVLWMEFGFKVLYVAGGIVAFVAGIYFLGAFLNKIADKEDVADQA